MLEVVWRAALLAAVGGGLGAALNAVRPDGLVIATYAPPVVCTTGDAALSSTGDSEGPEVRLVTLGEATALCAEPNTLIADVRSAEAFAEGHVAGAIHLPCSASAQMTSAAEDRLSGRHQLLVYGEATDDAFPVAQQMRRRLGRADLSIRVLEGGFRSWSTAGLACTSGECPACGAPAPNDHTDHPEPP
jgi:rhodanese-related sulfurtransferase